MLLHPDSTDWEDCKDCEACTDFNKFCLEMPTFFAFMAIAVSHAFLFASSPSANALQHPTYFPWWVTCHKFRDSTHCTPLIAKSGCSLLISSARLIRLHGLLGMQGLLWATCKRGIMWM